MADEPMSRQEELRNRTKRFALRIIRLFRSLPRSTEAQVLGKQLLRSADSSSGHRAISTTDGFQITRSPDEQIARSPSC
jgi:hypothetical protein